MEVESKVKKEEVKAMVKVIHSQVKKLMVGLTYGWGAVEVSQVSLFGISKEMDMELEKKGKEAREEYKGKKDKIRNKRSGFSSYNTPVLPFVQQKAPIIGGTGRNRQNSPCFACGQVGHWATECPNKKRS